MYNYIYNFTFCIFLNIVWNTNIPTMLQRMYLKNAFHNPGEIVTVLEHFYKMCVCPLINNSQGFKIAVANCANFVRELVKDILDLAIIIPLC